LAWQILSLITSGRKWNLPKAPLRFLRLWGFIVRMKNSLRYALLFSTLFAAGAWLVNARGDERPHSMSDYLVYIGTYNGPKSQGIYVYRLSTATGKLTPLGLAAASDKPAFLAIHPNHHYLYAVNEIEHYDGKQSGSVSAFSIDRTTGKLSLLNIVASGDPGPCHLSVDHTGKYLVVANYGVGSVASFPILPDGRLGKVVSFLPHTGHSVDPKRQEAPHAHSIYVSPDNRFVVSADLGTDQVYVYRFDANTGTLTPNNPPSAAVPLGTGPRHFAFNPNNKFAYAIEEMGSSLTAFSYDAAHGVLTPIETIKTTPKDYKGYNDCAELFMDPKGRFLYGSNRGHDSITVFAIDPAKGTPTPVQYVPTGGKTPRGFGIDPTGSYLIAGNQDSDSLVVFRIDAKTGHLTPTGQKEEVGSPICVVFDPM
jgi:6-phosphogluconolactonase